MSGSPPRVWLRFVPPREDHGTPLVAEHLYRSLRAGMTRGTAIQLLLLGRDDDVGLWLRVAGARAEPVTALLRGAYPEADVRQEAPRPAAGGSLHGAGARWRLARSAVYPVRTLRSFLPADSMALTLGVLAEAREGETGLLSALLRPASGGVTARAERAAHALAAQPGRQDLRAAVLAKAGQPAFRVTLRSLWLAPEPARADAGHAGLADALGQLAVEGQNALLPLRQDPRRVWQAVAGGRPPFREPAVLGAVERAALVHSPGADLVVPHLLRSGARRREPGPDLADGALHLADSRHRDPARPVGLPVEQLLLHAYVVGPSGTGKTSLLAGLVLGLAESGTAGVVLDPHGDLVRQVLRRLPARHLDRVRLLDLSDRDRLPGINPLWLPPDRSADPVARAMRSSGTAAVFADLWSLTRATTPNLLHFLEAGLAALVGCGTGCLAQLPRLLTDGPFRTGVVRAAADARVTARWAEFAALSHEERSRTVRAILNKAADFDRNPLLGTVFGDPGPGLQLEDVMDTGQLLLVSLPRGLVPEGTVELIGSVLVSMLYQAALAREARPAADRPPVVAVIDEFQEFALGTFAKVVTAARKYGLGLVVANQNLSRVRSVSHDVLETLLANVGTLVSFRTAPGDAAQLAPFFAPFTGKDLAELGPYECYWRLPGPGGPISVSARSRELPPALRGETELDGVRAGLRLPGRPITAATGPAPGWDT